jgi:hypothetical protein
VCLFIYNQYQFLASQSTTAKQETIASKSGEETKSSETNGKFMVSNNHKEQKDKI